jgi:hypothetical protein
MYSDWNLDNVRLLVINRYTLEATTVLSMEEALQHIDAALEYFAELLKSLSVGEDESSVVRNYLHRIISDIDGAALNVELERIIKNANVTFRAL